MSMWCPKCQNITYNKKRCDKCDYLIEDKIECHEIPKPKEPRILKQKNIQKEETSSYMGALDDVIDNLLTPAKKTIKENTETSYREKKSRGDEYEEYIALHYRKLGYDVIEHGKEKGVKDGGIDLIAKLENEVIFIQCKDWNENNSHKIDHKDIKVLRTDANDFLENNPIYKKHQIKLRYTLSGNFLHKSAQKYMEECNEDINYEIIKPTYRKAEKTRSNYIKKSLRKKKKIQGTYVEKVVIGFISILVILFLFKPKYETDQISQSSINKNMIVVSKPNQEVQRTRIEKSKLIKTKNITENRAISDRKIYRDKEKVLKVLNKKSERENAKAMLLIQMQK